uniref:Uncharacterized protein n=1 Tax=Ditylenchus dipsaci TaxID=166011 RepID=A0A915D2E5_9BILA
MNTEDAPCARMAAWQGDRWLSTLLLNDCRLYTQFVLATEAMLFSWWFSDEKEISVISMVCCTSSIGILVATPKHSLNLSLIDVKAT